MKMARLGLYFDLLERANLEDTRHAVNLRRRRRVDICNISEQEFIKSYRLNKSSAYKLIEELTPYLPPKIETTSIPVEIKVLTALAFFASGSIQKGVGQSIHHSIAQPTVSKFIKLVINALNRPEILRKYIKFPQTLEERNNLKQRFYEQFKIPDVIGCIDGTHVAIVKPANNEERFLNQNHNYSINTQIICDSDQNILSVDASHGGATLDSFIWKNHPVQTYLQRLHDNNESVWLLGDSGYPLRQWLMTPITDAARETPDSFYTSLHESAQNAVQRTIRELKARWRCLLPHRLLYYDPVTAGKIVNSCVVLHNIANRAKLPVPELTAKDLNQDQQFQVQISYSECMNQELQDGRDIRENLVGRLWNSRN